MSSSHKSKKSDASWRLCISILLNSQQDSAEMPYTLQSFMQKNGGRCWRTTRNPCRKRLPQAKTTTTEQELNAACLNPLAASWGGSARPCSVLGRVPTAPAAGLGSPRIPFSRGSATPVFRAPETSSATAPFVWITSRPRVSSLRSNVTSEKSFLERRQQARQRVSIAACSFPS